MTRSIFFLAWELERAFACRTSGTEVEVRDLAPKSQDDADKIAAAVAALNTLGYDGSGVVLGLPSASTYAAQVQTEGLPRKDRHQALAYRLEEHLPLDAESLTADFLPPLAGRALGIAIETQSLRNLADRLAVAGIRVEAVCPTALLALWQWGRLFPDTTEFVLLHFADHVDVFRIADGRPTSWFSTAPTPADVTRAIQASLLSQPTEGTGSFGLLTDSAPVTSLAHAIAQATGLTCRPASEEPVRHLAARAATALLAGHGAGWVDLAHGASASADRLGRFRRPLQVAAILFFALLAAVSAGALVRTAAYEHQIATIHKSEEAVFLRLYPNQRLPLCIHPYLESERARLVGLKGVGRAIPQHPAALDILRKVVTGLPTDLRNRLVMLRIDSYEVYLEGQARSHTDAEAIGRGIAAQGLSMEPPRTESLAKGGVAFTLAGQPVALTPKTTAPSKESRP